MAYPFDIPTGRGNLAYARGGTVLNQPIPPIAPATDVAAPATSSAITAGKAAASQIPGYLTSMGNIGTNIASETAGQVPDDVKKMLAQQSSEAAVSTGAASNAAYLKSLGLTSLGLKEQGQKDLESILQSTPGYNISQNPEFQTGANLSYEERLQQQVFELQKQQQQFEQQQQAEALSAAKSGLGAGGSWSAPVNAWSGSSFTDALGFPNVTTATLPGQTPASGEISTVIPSGGGVPIAYGPGGGPNVTTGPIDYSGLYDTENAYA